MEDLGITDPNAGLQLGSGAAAIDDGFGSGSGSGSGSAPPSDSVLSLLEIYGMADVEKMLGNGMSESDIASLESLQFGMELTDDEADNNFGDASRGKKKRKHEPKTTKRLSLSQVYHLEKNFKIENKLEPERKYELAKELGMKPKQVTIWFQNRRARSKKTKDVDLYIDFEQVLKQYDSLQADHEKLLKENKRLKAEMKDMRHEMVIMKDSLLKYGKLVRAGLLAPQVAKTKQLRVGQAQPHPAVEINNNVFNEGVVVAPQVQVQQQPVVHSPASENSVFDWNSPLATAQGGVQLLSAPVDYIPQPVVEPEPEPVENNTNLIRAEQENGVNQRDTIDNLIHNMLESDEQNGLSNKTQADVPQINTCDFRVNPIDMDDEFFWQFEL